MFLLSTYHIYFVTEHSILKLLSNMLVLFLETFWKYITASVQTNELSSSY